jgi:two-component system cell cycle response regulator DivK
MPATILVVEDNPQNRYLARFLLEQAGYAVLEAADADAGLDTARGQLPDLVLMDILLPGMDGYEATRRLKSEEATASIPVVALTAYSMEGDEDRALASGCDGYITKPVDPSDFAERVARFLEAAE